MAELTRELAQPAAHTLTGSHVVPHHDGRELDLGGDWHTVTLYGALSDALGTEVTVQTPIARLTEFAGKHDVAVDPKRSAGEPAEELFEALVVPGLIEPTFVRDYPEETSPLTRAHRQVPGLTEVAQSLLAAKGDPDAMSLDEDSLRAMEYGMPPAGGMGMGMGIDRLLMVLTGLGIRETILFPLVRPE